METRALLRSAFVILAFTFPALLKAQFPAPNPDELKMTSDPKAPGAAAVYLEINENDNDPMHYQRYYVRIKVLTEKGKELATQQIRYLANGFKINDIKGRTIHADGTVIPLTVKPEDLLVAKAGERQLNKKVFTLPSVEVGSVLEFRYQLDYDDNMQFSPTWDVQQKYFVHKAHYEFTPFNAFLPNAQTSSYMEDEHGQVLNTLIYWWRLPNDAKVVQAPSTGRYSADVTDVPAAPDEEYMPPIDSQLYAVRFYYKSAATQGQFWMEAGKRWSKEVNRFADPSKAIHDAVAGLVAPSDSEMDKAKKLYTAVQALDNTDYSRTKTESERQKLKLKVAKRAEDTWAQKSGNSEDIALLYLAMLRAAGLAAYPFKVVDRSRWIFDPNYMEVNQFDDTIVILTSGGKDTVLDPGEKMCPFGTVNWKHSNTWGIRESATGEALSLSPPQVYTANAITRTGTIEVDEHGGVSGKINMIMTGQEALRWRQTALENDADEVKKRFDHELEEITPDGIEAHIDHFLGIDMPDSNLMAVVNVKGTLGTSTAKRLLLPSYFFETRSKAPFVNEEKRLTPVDMEYSSSVTEQLTYMLPAGVTVEGASADANVLWAGHAQYLTKSKTEPGQIAIARLLARAFTDAKPEEYQDLRGFYSKVAAADQAEVVLTAAAAPAKGN
jgi:hypothetical protein